MSHNIYNRNSKRTKGMTKPKNPTHDAAKAAAPAAVFAALPLIAFLLVGCSVGPRYKGTTAKLQPFHTAPSIEARKAGARLKPAGVLTAQSTSFRQSLESPTGRFAGAFPSFDRNQSYLDLGA